jgi:hypothetical protein
MLGGAVGGCSTEVIVVSAAAIAGALRNADVAPMVRDTAAAFAIVLRRPDAGERPSNLAEDGSSDTRLRYDADAEAGGVIPHPRPGRW